MPTVVNKKILPPMSNLINVFCLPSCCVEDSEAVHQGEKRCGDQLMMSARDPGAAMVARLL